MRIQIIVVALLLLTSSAFAKSNKEMRELFDKYEDVMKRQKVELVDEVFTKEFFKTHGTKEEFIAKVKTLPFEKKKTGLGALLTRWKRSKLGKFFSAKVDKTEFIIKEEDGKLKIDGTISDG